MLDTALSPCDAVSGIQQCPSGDRQGNFCFSCNKSVWSTVGFSAHKEQDKHFGLQMISLSLRRDKNKVLQETFNHVLFCAASEAMSIFNTEGCNKEIKFWRPGTIPSVNWPH